MHQKKRTGHGPKRWATGPFRHRKITSAGYRVIAPLPRYVSSQKMTSLSVAYQAHALQYLEAEVTDFELAPNQYPHEHVM